MENQLAVLVQSHCERTGDTIASIAARGGISRGTLSGLVNGGRSFPRASTLQALATGLGLPYETVREAAVRNVIGDRDGAPPRPLVSAVTAQLDALTDPQLEVVLATARALKTKCPTAV